MYSHLRDCVGSKGDTMVLKICKARWRICFQGPLTREAGFNDSNDLIVLCADIKGTRIHDLCRYALSDEINTSPANEPLKLNTKSMRANLKIFQAKQLSGQKSCSVQLLALFQPQ